MPLDSNEGYGRQDDGFHGGYDDGFRPEAALPPRARPNARPGSPAQPPFPREDFAPPRSRKSPARTPARDYEPALADPLFEDDEDDLDDRPAQRIRRRVPISRNARPQSRFGGKWVRIGIALAAIAILALLTTIFIVVRNFFLEDPRFRIDSASSIQVIGNSEIGRTQLLNVFGEDIGHNIFRVPLARRRADLQKLPWVEHATVMRLLPDQLRVAIVERVPVAFVRTGSKIQLVDAGGVLLDMPSSILAARHYSFPVVSGIDASDPENIRAVRMQEYARFIAALNATQDGTKPGPKPSQQLSEVDVTDPEDIRAIMPSAGTDILVHFGDEDFANRFRIYQQHLKQWRQQYPHLAGVDLRYDRQTVLEMDHSAEAKAIDTTPSLTATPTAPAAAKKALRKPAGARPAANKSAPPKARARD